MEYKRLNTLIHSIVPSAVFFLAFFDGVIEFPLLIQHLRNAPACLSRLLPHRPREGVADCGR